MLEGEIREDMDTDKMALPAYRRGHPIGFSLCDEDENYVLYIGDDPKEDYKLNLELRNTSAQEIKFETLGDKASKDKHHFELVFRNGVLSDKTLKKLRENKDEIVLKTGPWDLYSPGESQSGTISVYLLYKDNETSKPFKPGQSLIIPLRNISANAGSGARGIRIELKLNQLAYIGETTPITGSRIQHLQIINHLGSRRLPLHIGFAGSNRILNDGFSANTLVLQLMNVLKSQQDTSVKLKSDSKFLISFDVQSGNVVAPWSLCTEGEIKELSIIVAKKGNPVSDAGQWDVARTDHGQGESPVWSLSPKQDTDLKRDHYIQIQISNIKTSLPSGLTNLYLEYRNIPGFWDGQVVCAIEKAPLLFYDVKNQQRQYTGELRVGIGSVNPGAKLEIVMTPKDGNTKPLVISRKDENYLTVLDNGNVGIGTPSPGAKLSIMGGGLHVGGVSDPGPKNLLVDGTLDVAAGRVRIGGPESGTSKTLSFSPDTGDDGRAGKIAYKANWGDGDGAENALSIVGAGPQAPNRSIILYDNVLIKGSLRVNRIDGVGTTAGNDVRVAGGLEILAEFPHNPMRFTSRYSKMPEKTTIGAEISNDTKEFKTLMIVGNRYMGFEPRDGLSKESYYLQPLDVGSDVLKKAQRCVSVWDRLDVHGELFQMLTLIPCDKQSDWQTNLNHPVRNYFRKKLSGQPPGTIVHAMADYPDWRNLYWIGWVGNDGKVKMAWETHRETVGVDEKSQPK
jgi:hypothetical protein